LRLSVGLGLGVTGVSLLLCLVAVFAHGGPIDPLLLCLVGAIHAVGGCVLTAVGVLGGYVGRVFEEAQRRPIFLLKDAPPFPRTDAADDPRAAIRGRLGRADRAAAA